MELLDILAIIGKTCIYSYEYWLAIILSFSSQHYGTALIYLAGILWSLELIPQIIKTVKSKNVEGVSLAFFSMCLIAYSLYAIGNYLLGNWSILIAHIPSLVLNCIMIILIVIYKEKK